MNKKLLAMLNALNSSEINTLKDKLFAKPMLGRLFEFLIMNQSNTFHTAEAVRFLYPNDATSYATLENRFYKLRKELIAIIPSDKPKVNNNEILTDEEQTYYFYKNEILNGRGNLIIKDFKKFEKKCRSLNLLEIWSDCIQMIIYYNQISNQLAENKVYFKLLNEAIQLQYELNKVVATGRKIYEINYKRALKSANHHFELIKRIALKNKKYPRFSLCYHYLSMYYKIGSGEYTDKTHITVRHLDRLKFIRAKHPMMPILNLTIGYVAKLNFHLVEVQAFYYYNTQKFKKSFDLYEELLENDTQFTNSPRSEVQLINMITISNAAEEYHAALFFIKELEKFYDYQQVIGRDLEITVRELRVEALSLGQFKSNYSDDPVEFLKKFVATTQKESHDELISDAIFSILHFYLMRLDFHGARRVFRNKMLIDAQGGKELIKIFEKVINSIEDAQMLKLNINQKLKQELVRYFEAKDLPRIPIMLIQKRWFVKWFDAKFTDNSK